LSRNTKKWSNETWQQCETLGIFFDGLTQYQEYKELFK